MLLVRPAGDEREADVRDRRAGQHTAVDPLGQMPEDQPLPVQGQRVGRTHRVELQAGAGLRRLHQQVDLGVVPQRLIMPHALDRGGDGLEIDDIALVEGDLQPEALRDQLLQDLHLHRAHQLHADLAQQRVPDQMQRGILLFQHAQLAVGLRGVGPVGQKQPVFQNRLQGRGLRRRLMAEGHAGHRLRQAGHGADRPGRGLLQERKLAAGIQAELVRLLLPVLAREQLLDTKRAARDLQEGQPRALFVPRDLIDARAEVGPVCRRLHEAAQRVQQRVHALPLQGGTKEARKHLPVRDGGRDLRVRDPAGGEIFIEQRIVTEGQFFLKLRLRLRKVDAALVELLPEALQKGVMVGRADVHLVDEHDRRHLIAPQQLPERRGMPLHARRAAHDQHGAVEHLQRPLHLGGKIDVAGGIEQRQRAARQGQDGLLGKDRDAAAALLRVGIEKRIPVVDAPEGADDARLIEHGLRQRRLARVHMREQTHAKALFRLM